MSDGVSADQLFSLIPQVDVAIEGVMFRTGVFAQPAEPDTFGLQKSEAMIERLRELIGAFDRPRIVELGIYLGGSVALLSLLADPTLLVSLELDPQRVERLDRFIEQRGLSGRVRPHYGVDQSDRQAVGSIVSDELDGQPLDLVIDDASHDYEPTVASFEVLFPRLRPGGLYLVEDWCRHDKLAAAILHTLTSQAAPPSALVDLLASSEPVVPLSRLAAELVLLRAAGDGVVDQVSVDENWIVARRGPGPLDPASFRLHDALGDPFGTLAPL